MGSNFTPVWNSIPLALMNPYKYEKKARQDRRRRTAGFSLIEILVVIALIAMILGLVVTNFNTIFSENNEKIASAYVNSSLKVPLTQYKISMGNYPNTEEGLKALIQAPTGKEARWKGPYVDQLPEDPWKNAYQYRFPGTKNPNGYDLWSYGPDGVESADDIGNWSDS